MSATLRGIRNAFRRPGRTVAIVALVGLAIGLALSMAVARQAVDAQIHDVQANTGTILEVQPSREADLFAAPASGGGGRQGTIAFGPGTGSTLNQSDLAFLAYEPHVASHSLDLSGMLDAEETDLKSAFQPPPGRQLPEGFSPPLLAFGTTSPDRVPLAGGGAIMIARPGAQPVVEEQPEDSFHLTEGAAFDGWSEAREAILGERVAQANDLHTGDTFTLANETIAVVGVYASGNDFADGAILLPLATMQDLTNRTGKVSQAQVRVDLLENVPAVQASLEGELGESAEVVAQDELAGQAIGPLRDIGSLAWASLVGAAVAAGAITVLTMAIIVRERRREIGVLKAIGAAPRHILRQFAAESATLASLGALLGVGFAALAHDKVLRTLALQSGAASASLESALGAWTVAAAIVGGLALALAGALVPAILVTRIRPADVLRGA